MSGGVSLDNRFFLTSTSTLVLPITRNPLPLLIINYKLPTGVLIMAKKEDKKIKEAVALQYTPGENSAPKLIALGRGEIAEKLIEKAEQTNVPVYENAGLAHTLVKLELGSEIPPELYEVVAEMLVFISNVDRSYGEKYGI